MKIWVERHPTDVGPLGYPTDVFWFVCESCGEPLKDKKNAIVVFEPLNGHPTEAEFHFVHMNTCELGGPTSYVALDRFLWTVTNALDAG